MKTNTKLVDRIVDEIKAKENALAAKSKCFHMQKIEKEFLEAVEYIRGFEHGYRKGCLKGKTPIKRYTIRENK